MLVEQAGSRILTAERPARVAEPERQQPQRSPRASKAQLLAETAQPSSAADSVRQTSEARLSYDRDLNRVFVEIVDSDTGDVVDRFPPEELTRHMDEMIRRNEAKASGNGAGLLVDQVV